MLKNSQPDQEISKVLMFGDLGSELGWEVFGPELIHDLLTNVELFIKQ